MKRVINDKKRSNEYVALRAELLSLHERAHSVWRWGLIAIVTVLGVVAATLIDLHKAGLKSEPSMLLASPCGPYIIGILVYVFAAGIAIYLAKLSANIQHAMHRVGAYLAVFHDQQSAKAYRLVYSLGWHVWNRIEKDEDSTKDSKPSFGRGEYHGVPIISYVLALGFLVICVSVLLSAITEKADFVYLLILGIIVCVAVWSNLRKTEQQVKEEAKKWNLRWAQLSQWEDSKIKSNLQQVGLRSPLGSSNAFEAQHIWWRRLTRHSSGRS